MSLSYVLVALGLLAGSAMVMPDLARAEEKVDHSKMDHSKMDHGQPSENASPAIAAFEEANAKMHKDMAITYTGDADADFLRGMIPHHQGAVDMAKIVLAHGKDPAVRKLAEEIIAAQEKEIAMMKAWLAARGVNP
jgi:uncharacterized protein (DUF305 family)